MSRSLSAMASLIDSNVDRARREQLDQSTVCSQGEYAQDSPRDNRRPRDEDVEPGAQHSRLAESGDHVRSVAEVVGRPAADDLVAQGQPDLACRLIGLRERSPTLDAEAVAVGRELVHAPRSSVVSHVNVPQTRLPRMSGKEGPR